MLLIKPASGNCNMRCKYCFYNDEMRLRKDANRGMMSLETLECIVKNAMDESKVSCTFGFQGGEPLLVGLGFYEKLIEFQERYSRPGLRIANTIQTNGLLINKEWAQFFAKNNFLVGLSVDGHKDIHDMFRQDAAGKETFVRCLKAAQILAANKVEFNILSVVTRRLASHPVKVWNTYKKYNFKHIQLIPCLDALDNLSGNKHSLTADDYGAFLCKLFDLWYDDFVKGEYYSVRTFDNYINMLMGKPPESCTMNGYCQVYALIEADGTVYPCDFYARDNYEIGNVHTSSFADMFSGEAAQRFIRESRAVLPECSTCGIYPICRAGCRRDREPFVNGMPSLNRFCSAYKKIFSYALPRMQHIARRLSSPG